MINLNILLKGVLIISGLLFHITGNSQHSFKYFTDPYRTLDPDSAINLTKGLAWDDLGYNIDLDMGFDFNLDGTYYDSIRISPVGANIGFFQECRTPFLPAGPQLNAFSTGLTDRGTHIIPSTPESPILFQTMGSPGARKTVIEWKNAGLTVGDNVTDSINFQVWFYEENNQIEIRYGPGNVADTLDSWLFIPEGPGVSLAWEVQCFNPSPPGGIEGMLIYGNRNAPKDSIVDTVTGTNLPAYLVHISGLPDNGMVYQFNPWPTGIENPIIPTGILEKSEVKIFPNPVMDCFNLKAIGFEDKGIRISILDQLGRLLLNSNNNQYQDNRIDVSGLPSGIYFVSVTDGKRSNTKKFIKY